MPPLILRTVSRPFLAPRPHLSSLITSDRPRRPFTSTALRAASDPESQTSHPQRSAQQDRNSINTEGNEYSKTGTDGGTAQQEQAAFDPSITDPQQAKDKAGEGQSGNPLDVSPANPDVSQGTSETEGGAGKKISEGGGGRSGGGDASGDKHGGSSI